MNRFLRIDIPLPDDEELNNELLDLKNTGHRVQRMYGELLSSYAPGAYDQLVKGFTCFSSDGRDAMVLEGPIDFHSLCSHHLLPFSGSAFVAYVPRSKVVGASKIPRVVEHYSRMLQIQERLTRQVAEFIHEKADAVTTIVLVKAVHYCMRCRGVKQQNTNMVTTAVMPTLGGEDDEATRAILAEFYQQLRIIDH